MSITDRLREYADRLGNSRDPWCGIARDLSSIADAIEQEVGGMRDFCERLDDAATKREDVTLWGVDYTALPLDADGVPIHVGDVMEWVDPDGEVTVTCTVDAVGVECFFAWDAANCRYAQKCANAYRHHHEPTVEDVLREFAAKVEPSWRVTELPNATLAEYAKRLRLAGDE